MADATIATKNCSGSVHRWAPSWCCPSFEGHETLFEGDTQRGVT
jgi:hypothetical protein